MASGELRSRRATAESARADGHALDPLIAESWARCEETVAESSHAAPVDTEPDEVRERWEASPVKRSGVDVEGQLARAAEDGDLVAAVTDPDGRILWSAGGRQMSRIAEQVGFVPGGRWDETSAGTNALAMAIVTGQASTVFSAEHWCDAVRDWVCWSVPVHGPNGETIGVLDLSGKWHQATPIAELAVSALAQLVEAHLPDDVAPPSGNGLVIRLLGGAEITYGGRRLPLTPRQAELLSALAIGGPASLDELTDKVYGDRPVSRTTVKAELSHLRRLLGGAIASRPYRLEVPVEVDVLELHRLLRGGDLHAAASTYAGQVLPQSDAPFAIDQRHLTDVALRSSLLESGEVADLLRYAEIHRYDEAVLERAVGLAEPTDPLHHEAVARLQLAQDG
jgi:hypothetical protein